MMHFQFDFALNLLRQGKKVARAGWNGKDMFIYLVEANKYIAQSHAIKAHFEDDLVPYGAYLAMKTANNNVVPWNPSQTCLLADDWTEVI